VGFDRKVVSKNLRWKGSSPLLLLLHIKLAGPIKCGEFYD
jgi:hypothetical protein